MSDQMPLFVEDFYEALSATVAALGGFKKIGAELRPELPVDHAGRWLSDCCNAHRDHELKPAQVALIRRKARAAGVHILAAFEMREAGYQPPVAIVVEEEIARTMGDIRSTMTRLEALTAEVKRLESLA